ncbi:MAG: PKD domain-containing protein [Bacteroidota bacterium]
MNKKIGLFIIFLLFLGIKVNAQSGLCGGGTPFFQVNLVGNPNGTWVSNPPVVRADTCCGNTGNSMRCIEFELILDPATVAISFNIASGAIPPGAMYYQINCGPPVQVGEFICIIGPGPHTLTFCKPGNNQNTYEITAYSNPYLDPDTYTTDNCQIQLHAYGVDSTTITWNDITSGGLYNSFLSCTTCISPYFTPHTPYPGYIDYQVCAMPIAASCNSAPMWCDTIRVYLVPKLTVSIGPSSPSYCANQSGILLTANTTGGAQPFTYIWTNATGTVVGNSSTYFATNPGTYYIEIQDTLYNQCGSQSASINVVMNPLPNVSVVPQTSTICTGSSVSITASGGTGYQWSNGSSSSSITVTPATTTTYYVTVTNTYGCTATGSSTVTVNSLPVPNAGADQTLCQGQSAILTVTGGSTYVWSNGATTSSINVTPSGTTTYTVTATSNGCTATDAVAVNVNPIPAASAGPDQTICQGQSVALTASGGTSYQWSNGASTASTSVNPASSTNYVVTVTNAFGCTALDNVTVNVNATPTANAGADQTICQGQVTTVTASGGSSYLWNTGTGTSSIIVSPSSTSTYTVTVTGGNGCTASDNVVVYVNASPTASAGPDQSLCSGQSISITASGGSSYLWNTGATTSSISISPASTTTYTVTVTSGNGCSATDAVLVTVNPTPTANAGTDVTICLGQGTTLTASGGSSYQWSTGGNTATINVNPASTTSYTVTVTNTSGCNASDNVIVNVNPLPPADAGADQMICAGQSTTLTASGGSSYIWSTGSGNISINVTPASTSTYTVTVTGINGCTAFDNVSVYVNALPVPNAGIDQTICQGQSASLVASGGASYQWNTGANTSSINVTPSSTSTYTVTVTSGNGCTASDNVTVNVNTLPVAYASADQTICVGGSTTLTASGGSSYQWSTGGNTASICVTPAVTTNYIVTVTASNGCTASDNVFVYVNTLPTAFAGPDQTICQGQSSTLNASGGTSYQWNNGLTTPSINVSPSSTTTYSVTVTSNGCSASDNVVITVNALPSAYAGTDQSVCQGQSVTLTATGGASYSWSNGGNTASVNVSPSNSTTYYVTVTSSNGCSASDNVVVTVNSLPAAYAGVDQTVCQGLSATLTASGGSTYLWSTGANTASVTVSPSSTTTYSVTVTGVNGCTASDNAVVNVNTIPIANAGNDQTICQGQTATITASGGGTYQWNTGSNSSAINVTPASTATYTVTVTNANGCTDTDEAIINVNPLPIANAGSDQNVCPYQLTTLTASGGTSYIWNTGSPNASINVSPSSTTTYTVTVTSNGCQATDAVTVNINPLSVANAGPDHTICPGETAVLAATTAGSYLWSNGMTTQSISVSPATSATYTLTVSSGGCSSTDDVFVNVAATLTADAGADQVICTGQSANLVASGGSNYLWSTGATTNSINVSPAGNTTYTVTTTSGTCSATDEVIVTVNSVPTADAGTNQTICEGSFSTISATGGTSYLWSNGSVSSSQIIAPSVTTNYFVTVTGANGCTASDVVTINVNNLPVANAGVDETVCQGQSATLNASGGTSYLWSTGVTTASVSVTPTSTTTYSVTVTNAGGCSATDNAVVSVLYLPTANAGTDQTICLGQAATLTASLGTSYQWNTGATTATIIVSPSVSSTTYTVTVTSSNGCTASDAVLVNVNTLPVANAGSDQSICQGGSVTITASGGSSYIWSNGLSSSSFVVAPSVTTTFTVTASNLNGCTSSDDITVNINATPAASAGPDQTICVGQTATLVASGGANYLWNTGITSSTLTISPVVTTNYVVTVTSSNGCTASDNAIVNVNNLPTANAGADQTICQGYTATLTASAGSSYTWNTGGTSASINVSPSSTTAYTVTVVSSNGCSASDNVIINVNALPTANAGSDQSICYGASASLTATGGTSYLWSTGATTNSVNVTPYSTSNYIVTVTNSNGCSSTDEVSVFVNSLPLANAGSDQVLCQGQSTTLTATGGSNYLWSSGETIAAINISPSATTSYTVTVTNSSGCSAVDNVTVYVNALPISSAGADQIICQNQSATLTASGGSSYQWNIGASTASINVAPLTTTTYVVTVTNSNGCSSSDDVVVFVNTTPTAFAGTDQTICQGLSTSLTATGGTTYQWNNGSVGGSINISPSSTTTYTVTVTGSNGCYAVDDVTIFVNNLPVAYAGIDQTICFGQSTNLTATGGSSYQWSTGDVSATISVNPISTSTYIVTVYNNGCTATDDITVNINPSPTADAGSDQTICLGFSANLLASGGFYYQWSSGQNAPAINVAPMITSTYTVTVTGSNGCPATDETVVFVNSLPLANAGANQSICLGQTVTLVANGGSSYVWNTGAGTSSITVSPSSTTVYSVTVSNSNGCTSSDDVAVFVNSVPSANAGSDQTICEGQSVTFSTSGGSSYLWSTGSAASSISIVPSATTTYYVTVTSNNGCTATDDVTAFVNPTPTANAGVDQTICQGNTASLFASGGTSYLWNTGGNTASISVNPSSTTNYFITVTSNGCTASDDIIVTVNYPPPANAGPDQLICMDDTIQLSATGGSFYQWNTGAMTPAINVSPAVTTTYTVTVTGNNGCVATDDLTITVNSLPTAVINDQVICYGQSATLTASGGTTYSWSNGMSTSSITVSPLTDTYYSVTVTNNGCSASDNALITVNPLPSIGAGQDQTICDGTNVILNASGGLTYLWSTGETNASIIVTPNMATTYTVTGTDVNGCSATDGVTVIVNPLPAANAGTDQAICQGQTATLSATGGIDYLWSNGITSSINPVTPAFTTTYGVTVTSTASCSATDDVIVVVNPVPVANAGSDQTVCSGVMAVLTGSGGGTYNWSTGDTAATITVTPVISTTYSMTVTSNGCTSSDQVNVDIATPILSIYPSTPTICLGDSIQLAVSGATSYTWSPATGLNTASGNIVIASPAVTTVYTVTGSNALCWASQSITVVVNSIPYAEAGPDQTVCFGTIATFIASGGTTYQWSNGQMTASINVSPAATTTYSVTVTNNGCSASDNVTLNINPVPVPNAGPDVTICKGESVTLYSYNGASYLWNTGAITDSIIVIPDSTTMYFVTVTASNGCTASDDAIVYVNTAPPADAGPDQIICVGESVVLNASGGTYYVWSTGDTTNTISVTPPFSLTYIVTVTGNGCTATDEVFINVIPLPVISFFPDISSGCPPLLVNFINNTTPPNLTYFWNFGDGATSSAENPQHTYNNTGTYNVALMAYDTNGCSATQSFSGMISVFPSIDAEFSYYPSSVSSIDPAVQFYDQCDDAAFWSWNFGDTTSGIYNYSYESSPQHYFSGSGIFTIWLIATNSFGCIDSVRHTIEVTESISFYVPNGFTPNNDGINDIFLPVGLGIDPDHFTMYIFDRWGEEIFMTSDLYEGWNGIPAGSDKLCQIGVYVWLIEYKDIYGNEHKVNGRVTLVR